MLILIFQNQALLGKMAKGSLPFPQCGVIFREFREKSRGVFLYSQLKALQLTLTVDLLLSMFCFWVQVADEVLTQRYHTLLNFAYFWVFLIRNIFHGAFPKWVKMRPCCFGRGETRAMRIRTMVCYLPSGPADSPWSILVPNINHHGQKDWLGPNFCLYSQTTEKTQFLFSRPHAQFLFILVREEIMLHCSNTCHHPWIQKCAFWKIDISFRYDIIAVSSETAHNSSCILSL